MKRVVIPTLFITLFLFTAVSEAAWCSYSGGTGDCTGSGGKVSGSDWDSARTSAQNVTKCAVIESLAAADVNFEIWMANVAVTIMSVGCHCRGTCTTKAQISLEDRAGNAMTHTTPTCSETTGNTTFQSVTAGGGLAAGEGLAFDVDNAVSPETDTYTICFTFTVD